MKAIITITAKASRKVIREPSLESSEEGKAINQFTPDNEVKVIAHQGEGENVNVELLRRDGHQVNRHFPLLIALKDNPVLKRFCGKVVKGTGLMEQLLLHPFDLPLVHRRPFGILIHLYIAFSCRKHKQNAGGNNGGGCCFSQLLMILMIFCAFLILRAEENV